MAEGGLLAGFEGLNRVCRVCTANADCPAMVGGLQEVAIGSWKGIQGIPRKP
jgi:hypothetical protein